MRDDRGHDRGAVAVEAALVLPLLLLVVLGTIEVALYLRDAAAVTSAARHGARIASAEPRRADMVADVAAAVAATGGALPRGAVDELWVYQAGPTGFPLGTAGFTACATRCVRLRWSAAAGRFEQVGSGTWPPTSINACVGDPRSMSVGVYLRVRHRMLFAGLLGGAPERVVADRAVMRFEPMPARACGLGVS